MNKETRLLTHLNNFLVQTDDESCKGKESGPVDEFFSRCPKYDEGGTYMLNISEIVCYSSHVVKNKNEDPVYSDQKRSSKEVDKSTLNLVEGQQVNTVHRRYYNV